MVSLDASSNAFIAMRPMWTLAGSVVPLADCEITLEQSPFRWIDGVWEADVVVRRGQSADAPWHHLTLRIAADTARRWSEAGINPYLEACAQVREHLAGVRTARAMSFLTLL